MLRNLIACLGAMLVLLPGIAHAQRSTPVTINTAGNTVKIDSSNNTVIAKSRWTKVQLFPLTVNIANNAQLTSNYIDCSGYNSIRCVFVSSVTSANLKVAVIFGAPTGGGYPVATADFNSSTSVPLGQGGNITGPQGSSICTFIIPVMSDTVFFRFSNFTGSAQQLNNDCWVYMTN